MRKYRKKLVLTRKHNGKQLLTKISTTVSTPWKKGSRTSKRKMERKGFSESE